LSIFSAVFLDSGLNLEVTWNVIYNLINKELHEFMNDVPKQIVRQLYEYDKGAADPKFTEAFEIEEHQMIGVGVEVFIKDERKTFVGVGDNKKVAKKCAAKLALKALQT
jgi:endoribonuclease Dicer